MALTLTSLYETAKADISTISSFLIEGKTNETNAGIRCAIAAGRVFTVLMIGSAALHGVAALFAGATAAKVAVYAITCFLYTELYRFESNAMNFYEPAFYKGYSVNVNVVASWCKGLFFEGALVPLINFSK